MTRRFLRRLVRWSVLGAVGMACVACQLTEPAGTLPPVQPSVAAVLPATPQGQAPTSAPGTTGATPTARPGVPNTAIPTAARPSATVSNRPPATGDGSNLIVFNAMDGSLSVQNPATGAVQLLLRGSNQNFYDAPSFSPDGARIVFVFTQFDSAGKLSSEIRTIRTDGGDQRTLFTTPAGPPSYFGYPRYTHDGASILFSRITDGSATAGGYRIEIMRGPATGGEWMPLIGDGYQPHLSPDAKQLVYLRSDVRTLYTSLWVANADGSNPQVIVPADIFLEVAGPHFSPDGQWIVFAASGPPSRPLPTTHLPAAPARAQNTADSCALRLLFVCLVTRAYANGLPWELYLVSPDGKRFQKLTDMQLDSPWPAFSRDGRYVAFMTFENTYAYDRASQKVDTLNRVGGHGVIDWYQR